MSCGGSAELPPAASEPVGLSDLARSLGLPVHRPHHADGDALTTAQVFIALATHLDSVQAQTIGTLQQFSLHEAEKNPLAEGIAPPFRLQA